MDLCLSDSLENKVTVFCLRLKSLLLRYNGEQDSALNTQLVALQKTKILNDTGLLADVYSSLAVSYELSQLEVKAITYHLKALDIYKSMQDTVGVAVQYSNLSAFYIDQQNYERAIDYANQGLAYHKTPDVHHFSLKFRIATAYQQTDRNQEALELHNEILLESKTLNNTMILNMATIGKAMAYYELDEITNCKDILSNIPLEALDSSQKRNALMTLGTVELDEGNCNKASTYFSQLEPLIIPYGNHSLKKYYYRTLAFIEHCKGSSVETISSSLDSAMLYSDSLFLDEKTKEFKELDTRYKVKQTQDSLQTITLLNENSQIKASRYRLGFLSSFLGLILASIGGRSLFRRYQNQKTINDSLVFEKEELEDLNAKLQSQLTVLKDQPRKESTLISIKSQDKIHKLDLAKIKYVKAEDEGVRIFYDDTSLWLDVRLKKIEELTSGAGFVKIYRSTIVNLTYIAWVNHVTLKLKGGTELKIGRTYKSRIKEVIGQE